MNAMKRWFDELEKVLAAEARLAGLLEHGTMTGSAREFFVQRVLRSVLPPALHIGTGRVISASGETSKQIDVVIYDPQFPLMEAQPGQGLYLREGTMAAIEVKSELNRERTEEALENCLSTGLGQTYIFGFTGDATAATVSSRVEQWWQGRNRPLLPRVMVSGSIVGMRTDSRVGHVPDICFWKSQNPFGALLTELLTTFAVPCLTTGPMHWVQHYMPLDFYEAERATECVKWTTGTKPVEASRRLQPGT